MFATLQWMMLALLVLATGCTHYEYDVLQPSSLAGHVGTKEDLVLPLEPLSYHLRTVSDRLVVRVFNTTGDTIEIVGSKSAVVDPTGQSRPVKGQVVPPGAYAKFILPPVRPQYVSDDGPMRVRTGIGFGGDRREFGYDGYYDEPRTYTLQDGGEVYWDWKGETSAQMVLTFVRNGQEFKQELVVGRRKQE